LIKYKQYLKKDLIFKFAISKKEFKNFIFIKIIKILILENFQDTRLLVQEERKVCTV